MDHVLGRREFIVSVPCISTVAALWHGLPVVAGGEEASPKPADLWSTFPRQNPELVQEMVGVSHSNEQRVRELVGQHPALVHANWDWGYGDAESALGAASHVGQRGIAEFLLASGARLDIFAAAMLGYTHVVTAMVQARPGVQRTLGPHGIPLLDHALAGGDAAKQTVAYLESLGDAGQASPSQPLDPSGQQMYLGQYRFGSGADDVFEVQADKGKLSIKRTGDVGRRLFFVGDHAFFPAGAPSVRIRFMVAQGPADSLTVTDHRVLVQAARVH